MSANEAKIVTSFNGMGWTASRENYDLGMPVGASIKSADDAIRELLEAEAMEDDDEDTDTWNADDQQRYEYEMGKEANKRGDYWDEADLNEAEEVKND